MKRAGGSRKGGGAAAGEAAGGGGGTEDFIRLRPLTTVDVVIFAIRDDALQVLLVRRAAAPGEPYPERWALPGGFVDILRDEDLEACAIRKLEDKTGVRTPYLEQLGSWGDRTRDPRGWSVTNVYFALIPIESARHGANAADARWFPVRGTGADVTLAFDHDRILAAAVARLRGKVEYTSLPAYLLPKEFTLSDLQRVYEIILGRRVEKSAFRTRILAADLVVPLDKYRSGPNRPAQLYRLKSRAKPVNFPRTFNPASV